MKELRGLDYLSILLDSDSNASWRSSILTSPSFPLRYRGYTLTSQVKEKVNLWMKVGIDRTQLPESEVILIPKVGAERNLVLRRLFYIFRTNFFTFNHEALVSFAWLWVMIRNGTSFRSRNLTNRSIFRLFWTLFFKFTNILVPNFRDLMG